MTYPSSNGKVENETSENDCDKFVFDITEYTSVWSHK